MPMNPAHGRCQSGVSKRFGGGTVPITTHTRRPRRQTTATISQLVASFSLVRMRSCGCAVTTGCFLLLASFEDDHLFDESGGSRRQRLPVRRYLVSNQGEVLVAFPGDECEHV